MLSAWLYSHHGQIISRKPVGLSVGHEVCLVTSSRCSHQVLDASTLSYSTRVKWFVICFAGGILCSILVSFSPFKIERQLLSCVWLHTDECHECSVYIRLLPKSQVTFSCAMLALQALKKTSHMSLAFNEHIEVAWCHNISVCTLDVKMTGSIVTDTSCW